MRGDARSYEESVILNQVETLAQNGFSEFILTGTNVGSYGKKCILLWQNFLKMALIKGLRELEW